MITTKDLRKMGQVFYYGDEDLVIANMPYGEDIPFEWAQKIGVHYFDRPMVVEVKDVSLLGPALVGVKFGDVILDVGYFGRYDLYERNKPYIEMAAQAKHTPAKRVPLAMSLCSCWSGNYFHWLIDLLPMLEAAQMFYKLSGEKPLLLVPSSSQSFMTSSLDMSGFEYEAIEGFHYQVDRLLVPTVRRQEGYLHPKVIDWLRHYFLTQPEVFRSKRYYITRRSARVRRVENEEALEKRLSLMGFETVEMEKFDIREQAIMMSQARAIVSPHGSGLANIVFSHLAEVVELVAPQYTNPCCWLVGASAGAEYGYVVGKPINEEDIWVDVGEVERVVNAL